jgi:16S rRNA (uracil1498-N3)-methyltransferase
MRRFFVDPENIVGANAFLAGQEARHIAAVLRLATGTTITLFDGSGSYYEALLTRITFNRVEAKIVSITPYIDTGETSRPALHLAIALLKGKKMDFIIQKATELGVDSLRPFRSQYCAVHDHAANKLSRWQKIALEACKQCNRPKPPAIQEATDLGDLLTVSGQEQHDLKLIFWEETGGETMHQTLGPLREIKSSMIIIGPEGGFSYEEIADAVAAGYKSVTLGRQVLRSETAVIAAVSILQYKAGNLD